LDKLRESGKLRNRLLVVASIPSEYKRWIPCGQKAIDILPGKDSHAMVFFLDRTEKKLIGCESGNEYFQNRMLKYPDIKKFGMDIILALKESFEKYFKISIEAEIIRGPHLGAEAKLDSDCAPIAMYIAERLMMGKEFNSVFDHKGRIKYRNHVVSSMKAEAGNIKILEMSESVDEKEAEDESVYWD